MTTDYPTTRWIKQQLRDGVYAHTREPVLGLYLIGSESRGQSTSESDFDIAVIIKKKPMVSSLKFTERFHAKYRSDTSMPKWKGRRVDFQFFYPGEIEGLGYKAINIGGME